MPYSSRVAAIDEALGELMKAGSWRECAECPALAELAAVTVTFMRFDGGDGAGMVIVAASLAEEIELIFRRLYAARFPIESVRPIHEFGGSDDASMQANNSSAFNFRFVAGTQRLSMHAIGRALDINPVQNPIIVDARPIPPRGAAYLDRGDLRPGMIVRPGPCVEVFDELGWEWGGDWSSFKDYHHFVKPV